MGHRAVLACRASGRVIHRVRKKWMRRIRKSVLGVAARRFVASTVSAWLISVSESADDSRGEVCTANQH